MDAALIRQVWRRANGRCEYCQLSREFDDRAFEIDHIRSQKHLGPTVASNLALSCFRCNSFKGSDISGRNFKTWQTYAVIQPAPSQMDAALPLARCVPYRSHACWPRHRRGSQDQ